MIKRFVNQKSVTVTQAINCYGESCNAILTSVVSECCWISLQQVRFVMSQRYQKYLSISDEHLSQIKIEFERLYKACSEYDMGPDFSDNAGSICLNKSIVTCSKILEGTDGFEMCIPDAAMKGINNFDLLADIIRYEGEYKWLNENHKLIPFGIQLRSVLINEMERVFSGRVPGRQVWHTHKIL